MGVLPIRAVLKPFHETNGKGPVQRYGIPIEQVREEGIVAIGGKLVCHQLAILPNTKDVRNEEYRSILLCALGLSDISFNIVSELEGSSCGLSSCTISYSRVTKLNHGWTYSCFTPTVQQSEGG